MQEFYCFLLSKQLILILIVFLRFRPNQKRQEFEENVFEFCCCSNNQVMKLYQFTH